MMGSNRLQGVIGTVAVHVIVVLILLFVYMDKVEPQEEGGVPVLLGEVAQSQGEADPYTMTEVDVLEEPVPPQPEQATPLPETLDVPEMITQETEETVAVKTRKEEPQPEKKKDKPVKEAVKQPEPPKPVKTPEQIEAEKREAAEKAAAEAAAKKIAGAFGKGSAMGDRGTTTSGQGIEGSPTGNSDTGKSTGTGGLGTWDLNGRSLRGSLPVPRYDAQEEGRVVVTITVNSAGKVIATSINKRTNTMSTALRRAAEEAARKATFNTVEGVNNQTGTITYYFKLR